MANWSDLKAAVASIVKTNGNKEISGQLLQNVLNNIISNVGLNSSFAGIATPETNPGTPDANVFYLATTAGTYSNFNGIVINSGEAVILEWKGSWVKKDSGFATKEKLSELGSYYTSNKNLTDQMLQGANIIHGKIGDVISTENSNDGSFRSIKVSIEFGNTFVLSGTGAGRSYITSGYVTDNLTTSVVNGYYSYSSTGVGTATTANKTTDGGWRCIAQPVKSGDKVTITGVGGGGARLYCLVNNNNIIKEIAPSGDSQTGFVLDVSEDGILYCSFNKSYAYSLTREYYQETISSNAGARLYCITDYDGVIKEIAEPNASVQDLTIKSNGKGYLYINVLVAQPYSFSQKIDRLGDAESKLESIAAIVDSNSKGIITTLSELQLLSNDVNKLQSNLVEKITDDLTGSVSNGYYTYSSTAVGTTTTPIRDHDGGWRCIAQSVKAGDKVTITGTGGASARLYCLVNNNNIIKEIAPSGDSQTGFVLDVEEDGILYCSFVYSSVFSVVREYSVFKEGTLKGNWLNGSYEFGRTCNCDYTAPSIPPYSFPTTGKVAHINGLYDALVASYPKYVFKEDCDSVMKAMGVEKPSAIANLPMYMYKFMPPKAPNSSEYAATNSEANMIKAFVITGTHNEYIAVWDCYNAMRLICESWDEDKNLEELRWNAEIYVIPCYNLHGVENSIRTNERGVDLNRNAPTLDWKVQGSLGDSTYSGEAAGSEYSTKVMMYYLQTINPQIFIDHHNTNVGAGTDEGDGKNLMYSHSVNQIILDISSVMFSQMTRKWKKRYTNIFPSVEADATTIFGYTLYDHIKGSIGRYGSEQGALGSTFETNFGILYKNGEYSTANRQNNTEVVATCATEGFVNYLLRCLTACSSQVGILG